MKVGDEVLILEDRVIGGHAFLKAGQVTVIDGFSKSFPNIVHVKYSDYGSITVFKDKIKKLSKKSACEFILEKMRAA